MVIASALSVLVFLKDKDLEKLADFSLNELKVYQTSVVSYHCVYCILAYAAVP